MLTRLALPVRPIAIHPYFDKIQFWVCNPLDSQALALLESACGQGGMHMENRPARFGGGYRQRIELRQPSKKALQWLAKRNDAFINRAEIALDLVFQYRADRDQMLKFLHQHLIRRWHGKRQESESFEMEQLFLRSPTSGISGILDTMRAVRHETGSCFTDKITRVSQAK